MSIIDKKMINCYAIITVFVLLVVSLAAQTFPSSSMLMQRQGSSNATARAGDISLTDELRREISKKKEEMAKLSQFIPLEGVVDEKSYIVGPGDQFTINIAGSVEESYIVPVGADGLIALPYTCGVKVAGLSLSEAKSTIMTGLDDVFREGDLTVSLLCARLFVVHVTGHVELPGAYTVTAVDRPLSAIDLAGGYLPTADISRVKIIRGEETLSIDLSLYLSQGDISQNPYLLDGDIIVVPGSYLDAPSVFVSGGSEIDGYVRIDEGEDIRRLMVRVGADRSKINANDIVLFRDGQRYRIDLFESSEPLQLSDGDSIYFPVIPDSVYVGGRVVAGGSIPYIAGADHNAYVAMAGGIQKEGSSGSITIIRAGRKMSPKKAGMIRRGDVIIVETSTWTNILEFTKSFGEIASLATAIYVIGFRD